MRPLRILLMAISAAGILISSNGHAQLDPLIDVGSNGSDGALRFYQPPPTANRQEVQNMVYDHARAVIVRYDGYTGLTWEFDGEKWLPKQTTNHPSLGASGRQFPSLAYDRNRQVVVAFGGKDLFDSSSFDDTWEYNGTDWVEVNTATSPTPRHNSAMVFDVARNEVVLIGGHHGGVDHTDTWTYDGISWTLKSGVQPITSKSNNKATYDEIRGEIVFVNAYYTYIWDGTVWDARGRPGESIFVAHQSTFYHPNFQQVVMLAHNKVLGWDGLQWINLGPLEFNFDKNPVEFDVARNTVVGIDGNVTRLWDGINWSTPALSGPITNIDMSSRADGIYHYTDITIEPGVTVEFTSNAANTPVVWLASGDVDIQGTLDLNGAPGSGAAIIENQAKGGPGGGNGGVGGRRYDLSSSYAGFPGEGPGGGLPGLESGQCGGHASHSVGSPDNCNQNLDYSGATYGNQLIQPLIGGSGGGGGGSTINNDGPNAGGGGGAILIATNGTIEVGGNINASGGNAARSSYVLNGSYTYSGSGSGGAIRLVASRIEGSGTLTARYRGRIRTEAYYQSASLVRNTGNGLASGTVQPLASGGVIDSSNTNILIATIDGVAVSNPAAGNLNSVDVVFANDAEVTIGLTSSGIPEGTLINVRIISEGSAINVQSTPTGSDGSATVTVVVPAGLGKMQASASFIPSA
ncbi:MAG: hypothetical protein ACI8P9_004249 [Parasphingorhabdus sp.]|jgi:hypothetical protein